jgi:hypothetical protein
MRVISVGSATSYTASNPVASHSWDSSRSLATPSITSCSRLVTMTQLTGMIGLLPRW